MDEVKVVQLDTQPAQTSIKELRVQLKAYKDEMANLEEGSDEFLKVANAAGEVRHKIEEINQTVKASSNDFGDMVGNATKLTAGLVGGFNAAKGALTLMGVESEEVTKAIQKMQASMAIVQGLSAIDSGIKAFKNLATSIKVATKSLGAFKTALIATGLGALVVVLAEIAANWDTISQKLGLATKAQRDYNEEAEKLNRIYTQKAKLAQAQGKSALEVAEITKKGLYEESIEVQRGIIALRNKSKLKKEEQEQLEQLVKRSRELNNEIAISEATIAKLKHDNAEQEIKDRQRVEKEKADALNKQKTDKYTLEISKAKATIEDEEELNKKLLEIEKKRLKDFKKGSVEYYNQLVVIKNAEKKLVKDTYDEELQGLENVHTEELAKLQLQLYNKEITLKEYKEREKELNDTYKQDYIDYLQFLLDGDTLNAEQRIEVWKKMHDATKPETETEEKKDEEEPLNLELYSVQDALADLATDDSWGIIMKNMGNLAVKMADVGKQIKQNGKADWTAYAQIAAMALNSVGTVLNQLATQEDETDKEGFERKKKLEISGAIMNMLGGIVGAVASAMNPANAWMTTAGQIAMASIMSAMIAGVGAAQIASISKQQFGSTDTSGIGGTVSQSAVATTVIPPVQYSSAVQGASTEQTISNKRNYVAVTEIERVKNKVNVAETEAYY